MSKRSRSTAGPIPKTPAEVDAMAASGAVLAECLDLLEAAVAPGVTTLELDQMAEEFIRSRDGVPSFKGYHGFPGSICPSVNEEVVHAIPGPYALADGDIISIDCGVTLDGWVSDSARTIAVGQVSQVATDLMDATRRSLAAGISQARPGNRTGDIGAAVQDVVERAGFSVVRTLVGHGVGRSMHEEPQVPNFGQPGTGVRLEEGVVIAIEPMVTEKDPEVVLGGDGWVVSTRDMGLAAHFEHTVAITASGPRILTRVST
ncbi:MAG: type I methionyl aminopeptidase [Actinomycetota bacterium]|nr:type I methionyl aminopeptidase [Actinomycetota bacterium]